MSTKGSKKGGCLIIAFIFLIILNTIGSIFILTEKEYEPVWVLSTLIISNFFIGFLMTLIDILSSIEYNTRKEATQMPDRHISPVEVSDTEKNPKKEGLTEDCPACGNKNSIDDNNCSDCGLFLG